MPVTFKVATHAATPVQRRYSSADHVINSACDAMKKTSSTMEGDLYKTYTENFEIIQSSVNPTDYPAVRVSHNGFVQTVLEAWGRHRNLIIRPDDVWIAILTQFQFYVTANAETLRKSFVAHQEKKELTICLTGDSRYSTDFGQFARQMSGLLHENVVDKDLVRWILPDFSTTTETDTTVSAIILMATLKEYFNFTGGIVCGIPQVTLAGEKGDWTNILSRLDKLAEFGNEPHAWSHLLRTIITRFISAFDSPTSGANIDFWGRVAHRDSPYCGAEFLSGWITAFCVWDKHGKWVGNNVAELLKGEVGEPWNPLPEPRRRYEPERLILDGRPFSFIDYNSVPPGFAAVNVKLEDGEPSNCEMIAGHIGWHVLSKDSPSSTKNSAQTPVGFQPNDALIHTAGGSSTKEREALEENLGLGDTVQPALAWFIVTRKPNPPTVLDFGALGLGVADEDDEVETIGE